MHTMHMRGTFKRCICILYKGERKQGNKENPSALSEIKQFKCLVVEWQLELIVSQATDPPRVALLSKD